MLRSVLGFSARLDDASLEDWRSGLQRINLAPDDLFDISRVRDVADILTKQSWEAQEHWREIVVSLTSLQTALTAYMNDASSSE